MDTSIWGKAGSYKARLNAPLVLTDKRVSEAVKRLVETNTDLGQLRGAFRSTPLQPEAGIPIFGLVAGIGALLLVLVVWLLFAAHGGIGGFIQKMQVGGLVGVLVLTAISIGLMAFGIAKVRSIVRDLGQLLLVFENALVHLHPDGATVCYWRDVKALEHECVQMEYGGMNVGTEHVCTLVRKNDQKLVLLGRSYPTPEKPAEAESSSPAEGLLTDVQQVRDFIKLQRSFRTS